MPIVETSGYNLVLDPAEVAENRTQVFLNDQFITVQQEGIDWGDSQIQQYLADRDGYGGSLPVDFRAPNRTVTIPLGLNMGLGTETDFLDYRRRLQQKVGLIQRKGRGWLKRGDGLYLDLVNASLKLPDKYGETAGFEVGVTLTLEALPDFYGEEITLDLLAGTGHIEALLTAGGQPALIEGDYPGRARVIVTDTSAQQQNGMLYAFRADQYAAAASAQCDLAANTLTPIAPAARAGLAGAHAGVAITHSSVGSDWSALASTDLAGVGPLTHVGTYRVWARAYSDATPQLRLVWSAGALSSPRENPPASLPAAGDFYLVDLGQINTTVPYGTQRWSGRVEARGADSVSLDELILVPLGECAGRLHASPALDAYPASPVTYANGSCELRYDAIIRADPDGASYRKVRCFGDLARIPVSGVERRPVALLLRPSRGFPGPAPTGWSGPSADSGIDALTASVRYRPCYLQTP